MLEAINQREKKNKKEVEELAGRVKEKVKEKEYFKLPKDKERVLDIKLKEKIKSDIGSR